MAVAAKVEVRLARESDRAALATLAEAMQAELRPALPFDAQRWDDTFIRALHNTWPAILVVALDDEPVGFLIAGRGEWEAAAGFFVYQRLIYVRPDKRGTRAAATLLACFMKWAETLNPTEIYCSLGEGRSLKAAHRFLRRFGFKLAGEYTLRRPMG